MVGAGNVAIDAARSCLRLGADVTIVYRRDRDEMPANEHEIKDAIDETIRFMFMSAPHRIIGDLKGKVTGLEIHKMKFDGFDNSGRKKPVETGETAIIECNTVILAVGEKVDFEPAKEIGLELRKNGAVKVASAELSNEPAEGLCRRRCSDRTGNSFRSDGNCPSGRRSN